MQLRTHVSHEVPRRQPRRAFSDRSHFLPTQAEEGSPPGDGYRPESQRTGTGGMPFPLRRPDSDGLMLNVTQDSSYSHAFEGEAASGNSIRILVNARVPPATESGINVEDYNAEEIEDIMS